MLGALRGWKRVSDPLELELWVMVSHRVSGRNQTWVLCKSNKNPKPLSHLLRSLFHDLDRGAKELSQYDMKGA